MQARLIHVQRGVLQVVHVLVVADGVEHDTIFALGEQPKTFDDVALCLNGFLS